MYKVDYRDLLIEFTKKLSSTEVKDMNREDIDSLKDLSITIPYLINETDIVLFNISKILEKEDSKEYKDKEKELFDMKTEFIVAYELLEKKLVELKKEGLIK